MLNHKVISHQTDKESHYKQDYELSLFRDTYKSI